MMRWMGDGVDDGRGVLFRNVMVVGGSGCCYKFEFEYSLI